MKKILLSLALILPVQLWAQANIEVINIENPAVEAYMLDEAYHKSDDPNMSIIYQFSESERFKSMQKRLDIPRGKDVTWKATLSPERIKYFMITLSTKPNLTDSMTYFTKDGKETSYTLRNMYPNRTYYYSVVQVPNNTMDDMAEVASGTFRTTGQVRMMYIEGARNVRDMGGWMTQFGVPIKYGRMYRSAHLDKLTPAAVHEYFDNQRLRAELDLRGSFKKEPHLSESKISPNVQFHRIVSDAYNLTSQSSVNAANVTWIIQRLREGKVIDWHCGVGCDRCGTVSFLIGGVLGMSEIDLGRDFEFSCFSGHKRPRNKEGFSRMFPYIKKQGPAGDLAQCFYNYLVKAGVKKEDLDFLRAYMLDYR